MPTIAIDCRFAGTGTGLARYTQELTRALLARNDGDTSYILIARKTEDVASYAGTARINEADIGHYSLAEQTQLPTLLAKTEADLVFFPHFNAPFFCPVPFVATVHDLILHRYPGEASLAKRMAYRILLHRTLRRARGIVAVSAWTKSDIVASYGKRIGKKVTVIGEGVSDLYRPASPEQSAAVRARYGLQRPYFLYVGNAKPHKNVPFLLEAFHQSGVDADLIVVSGGADAERLSLPPNARLLTNVPDADLPALYSGARASVTASLEEGYYLPGIEALSCGSPVIATDRAAIPETLQDHALLLEPTLDAYIEAFQHPPTATPPIRLGSWDDAAFELSKLLRSIVTRS